MVGLDVESGGMVDEVAIGEKFRALAGELNERQRRLWAASEAKAAGRGGIAATARATGMAVDTIRKGIGELQAGESIGAGRVRKPGAGRKPLSDTDPKLLTDLERLVEADRRGDPESLLLWTSKSVRHLAGGLRELGHEVGYVTVAKLLRSLGYSLQANGKTREGRQHPDRDAQFEHINDCRQALRPTGQPAISVDTKKKELVGDFKNAGRELRRKGQPEPVRVHDFVIPATGQGRALRRLRHRRQPGLGQRRHRSRHRAASPSRASAAGGSTLGQAALSRRATRC